MKSNLLRRVPLPILAASLLTLALNGCGKGSGQMQAPPPPTVTIAPVTEENLIEWSEFTGRTEAVESVDIRPRVSGQIQEIRFQSGQLVKKGDVLFVIDPRPYKAAVDQRTAEYEQAKARYENTGRIAQRASKLLERNTIASEAADNSISGFAEAKAGLLAAQATLDSAKLDLEFTEVRAPIDGRVSRALLTVGNYVSGNAGAASLLTTLVSVNPIYVYTDVDENSLLRFNTLAAKRQAEGDTKPVAVEMELADEEGFPHKGYIESFDNRLDANTGTILLRAVFPNDNGRIVPGLFARIRVPASELQPTMLVDESSIGTDQAQKFVLTLDGQNNVVYRKVVLGPEINGKRVVRSGLSAGEKIIVNGLQRARPGLPVTPEERVAKQPDDSGKTAAR